MLTERTGRRWFVTGDAVADSSQRLSGLTAALNTTYALRHKCWLKFVIAPKAGIDGTLLSITGRYAIALYPHLDRLTDATADPQQIISMIIALHATTPDIGDLTPIDDLRIRDRPTLKPYWQARTSVATGPTPPPSPISSGSTGHRSANHSPPTTRRLPAWVTSSGHGSLPMGAEGQQHHDHRVRPVLVDWDTVQLAPRARDIWITESLDNYTAVTGPRSRLSSWSSIGSAGR